MAALVKTIRPMGKQFELTTSSHLGEQTWRFTPIEGRPFHCTLEYFTDTDDGLVVRILHVEAARRLYASLPK